MQIYENLKKSKNQSGYRKYGTIGYQVRNRLRMASST